MWPWFPIIDIEGPFWIQHGLRREPDPECHGPYPGPLTESKLLEAPQPSLCNGGSESSFFFNLRVTKEGKQRERFYHSSPWLDLRMPRLPPPQNSSEMTQHKVLHCF